MGRHTTMGRINLAPDEPALDARQLDALIGLWLDDCRSRLAAETVEGYGYKIAYFREWWARAGPERDWRLRRRNLAEFERELQTTPSRHGEPLSFNSRRDVLRRLTGVFKWAFREGYTETDYSAWVPEADGEPPIRQAAALPQLRKLFDAAADSSYAVRDRAILAVLIGTGMRRGECASLRVEDLRLYADGSGVATVRGKRTKGNRTGERLVAFDAATGRYLTAYLDVSGLARGPLWPGPKGPLTPQGVYRVVKRCVRLAGLEGVIAGPHDLRRTFATTLARYAKDSQLDGDRLRRQMGHATYRMTSQYSLLDVDDIRDSLRSPLAMMAPAAESEEE